MNATWDANGVFLKISNLYLFSDGDYYLYETTRKDNLLPAVIVLVAIGIVVLGVFWYYKKSQDRNIFRKLGTKVHVAVQRLRKPAQVQGTPLDWQCPGCGASIPRGSTYCLYCGEKVDREPKAIPWPETHSAPSSETQPEPQAERNESPQLTPAKQPAPTGPIPKEVLETLTFIALQQPIVLLLIASRRGSAALEHVQILENRGLVRREGTGPTAPVVTTEHFADTFGLSRDVKKMKVELKTDLEL